MAQENKHILTEHGGISLARHLLAIFVFVAVLGGNVVTWFFMGRRGAPDIMLLILYALFAVNGLQILLLIIDLVAKHSGRYLKGLTPFSRFIGFLWILILAFQAFVGYWELGDIRIDLIAIAAIQLIFAIVAYFSWPKIDSKAVRALKNKKVRDDFKKRRRTSVWFVIRYALLALVLIFVQAGVLFVYRLPPQTYDLFSDTRAVRYTPTTDGQGYIVTGIYEGTSPTVVIPAIYNRRPVVGIAEGAIVDIDFIEGHKINKIILGTETTDKNGNVQLVSNLEYIEDGAIVNDRITELTIPSSVTRIGDRAIDCRALTTLTYTARADFSMDYLNCSALKEIVLMGDNVGKIASLKGLHSGITLHIGKDIYNEYKRANAAYADQFVPILGEGEIYIDFYTNCDYYLDSVFSGTNPTIELHYSDLLNNTLGGPGLAADTFAYINDHHELGTDGAKKDSAFRGWFYDPELLTECVFPENGTVRFIRNSRLYAKWIDEYTGTLDWGTFQPVDQPTEIYWTKEDTVDLPVVQNRIGYTAGVAWISESGQVRDTSTLSESCVLHATWLFDAPSVDIIPKGDDPNGTGDFNFYNDNNSVKFTYDEARSLSLTAAVSHAFDGVSYNGLKTWYTYEWVKQGDVGITDTTPTVTKQLVADGGEYVLTAIVHSPYGETASASTSISVLIAKKPLASVLPDLIFDDGSTVYDGNLQKLTYVDHQGDVGKARVTATYTYRSADGQTVGGDDGVRNVGKYDVMLAFRKSDSRERANYEDFITYAEFEIKPRTLTFVRWQSVGDGDWTTESGLKLGVVYDGNPHTVEMVYDGLVSADSAVFALQYENNQATDVGSDAYFARVIGCNNSNYSIDEIKNNYCAFSVTPRPVRIESWVLDENKSSNIMSAKYDGNDHTVSVTLSNIILGDIVEAELIGGVARDAGDYRAKISKLSGDDAKNYSFPDTSQVWYITAKELTVSLANGDFIYNGKSQSITATISGFSEGEAVGVQLSMFDLSGTTVPETSGSESGGKYVIRFAATNANAGGGSSTGDTYKAVIAGLVHTFEGSVLRNYTLIPTTATLRIRPQKLTFTAGPSTIYNGATQELYVYIANLIDEDVLTITQSAFTFSGQSAVRFDMASRALVYSFRDAGTYTTVIQRFNNANYEIDGNSWSGSLIVNKKPLRVTGWTIFDAATRVESPVPLGQTPNVVYNYHGYSVTPVLNGVVEGEEVTLDLTSDFGQDVADYTTEATLSAAEYPNYSCSTTTLTWHITPYLLDFQWVARENIPIELGGEISFTYDAEEWNVTPVYTPLEDDIVTLTYSTSSISHATDFGSYHVTVTQTDDPNYAVGDGSVLNWKLAARPVTVTWDKDVVTGGYSGKYQGPAFSLDGLVASEVADGGLEVLYGVRGDTFAAFSNVVGSRFALNSGNMYSFIGEDGHAVDVGRYTFTLSAIAKNGVEDKNYTLTASSQTYEITQKELTLSAGWKYRNLLKTEGEDIAFGSDAALVYNTYAYTFTQSIVGGLVDRLGVPDDVTLLYEGAEATDYSADGYTAHVSGLSGTYAQNYKLPGSGTDCPYFIGKKVISLEWDESTFVYTGSEQTQTVHYGTVSPALGTDTDRMVLSGYPAELIVTGNTGTNATTYTALVSLPEDCNYTFDRLSATSYEWTITPRPVAMTWSFESTVYNGEVQYPTASFVYNDITVRADAYDRTDSIMANDGADQLKYTISVRSVDNANFTLLEGSGITWQYTITKRVLEFEWQIEGTGAAARSEYTYDGTARTVVAHVTNLCNEDVLTLAYSENVIRDVSEYTVSLLSTGNGNYAIPERDQSFSVRIVPAVVQIAWSWDGGEEQSFVFDGNPHTLTPRVTNIFSDDDVTLVFGTNTRLDQGTTTVTVSGVDNSNYTLNGATNLTQTLTVLRQQVSITWEGQENVVFDGEPHALIPTVVGANDNCTGISSVTYSNGTNLTNVGTTTITVALTNDNYMLGDAVYRKTLTILPQPVSIEWTGDGTEIYDGETYSLTASVKGLNDHLAVGFRYHKGSSSSADPYSIVNVGELQVNITLDNSNYTTEGANGTTSATLVISKQIVNVTWSGFEKGNSIVYDGELHTLTATALGQKANSPVEIRYTGRGTNYTSSNSIRDVGYLTTTITLVDSANYTFSGGTGDTTVTLTITPQPVTITWKWDGGEQRTFTYDGKPHTLLAEVNGKNDKQAVVFSYRSTGGTSSSANTLTNAGTLTADIVLGNSNYTLNDAVGASRESLIIGKQAVKITWLGEETVTYNGSEQSLAAQVVGADDGAPVTFSYANNNRSTNVCSIEVRVKIPESSNYEITADSGESFKIFTIKPIVVVLNWSGSETVTYTGSVYSRTATIANLARNESFTLTYTATKLSEYGEIAANGSGTQHAGEYMISVTSISNQNYTLDGADADQLSAKLTILPQKVKISWSETGSIVYDGNAHTLAATVRGVDTNTLVSDIVYSKTSNSITNVGSLELSFTLSSTGHTNTNYTLEEAQGSTSAQLTITPRVAQFTWSGATSVVFDGNYHALTAQVANKTSRDTFSIGYLLTRRSDYGDEGNSATNEAMHAGEYTITVVSLGNENFTLAGAQNALKELAISPRTIQVTWGKETAVTYDGFPHQLDVTVTGAQNAVLSPSFTSQSGMEDALPGRISFTSVGTYTYTISGIDNTDYTLDGATNLSARLTIEPRKAEIKWTGEETVEYDGQEHLVVASVSNAAEKDAFVFTYSAEKQSEYGNIDPTKNGATEAGIYVITLTGIGNENYTLEGVTNLTVQLTIEPRKAEIEWTGDETVEYDGAEHRLVASVFNKVGEDAFVFTYSAVKQSEYGKIDPAENGATEAGIYVITLSDVGNVNYTIMASEAITKTLTIAQQKVQIAWTGEGTFTYNGTAHTLTVSVTGATDEKEVPFHTSGTDSVTDVGSAQLTVSLDSENYTLDGATGEVSQTIEITPCVVNLTWQQPEDLVANGEVKEFTLTISNLLEGDVGEVELTVKITNAAGEVVQPDEITSADTYTVTVTGLSGSRSGNYRLAEEQLTFQFTITDPQVE